MVDAGDYVEGRGGLVHSCDGADQRVLSDVRPDNYTGSIDAALALVERMLPDSRGDVHWGNRGAKASVLCPDGSRTYHEGATPALAILKALFAAKERQP